jgi:hypothetical protein
MQHSFKADTVVLGDMLSLVGQAGIIHHMNGSTGREMQQQVAICSCSAMGNSVVNKHADAVLTFYCAHTCCSRIMKKHLPT